MTTRLSAMTDDAPIGEDLPSSQPPTPGDTAAGSLSPCFLVRILERQTRLLEIMTEDLRHLSEGLPTFVGTDKGPLGAENSLRETERKRKSEESSRSTDCKKLCEEAPSTHHNRYIKDATPTPTSGMSRTCFGCGHPRHVVANCPRKTATPAATPT